MDYQPEPMFEYAATLAFDEHKALRKRGDLPGVPSPWYQLFNYLVKEDLEKQGER